MRLPFACATLFVICSSASLLANDKPAKPQAASLYPLKVGAKWEWTSSTKPQEKRVEEIVGTKKLNHIDCFEVRTKNYRKENGFWKPDVRDRAEDGSDRAKYLAHSDEGWFVVAIAGGYGPIVALDGRTMKLDTPVCFLKPRKESETTVRWDSSSNAELPFRLVNPNAPPERRVVSLERVSLGGTYTQSHDLVRNDGQALDFVRVTLGARKGEPEQERVLYVAGKGPVKHEYLADGKVIETWEATYSDSDPVTVADVVLDAGFTEKDASTEEVEAPPGVVTEFEKSRTITREVGFGTKVSVGTEGKAGAELNLVAVKTELSLKIKAAIEAETKEKLTDTETRRQKVTIDGDKLPKARIVWVDVYKTGTVEVTKDGKSYKVPFEFPYGTKLVVRKRPD